MKIVDLKVNHIKEPIGFDVETIVINFKVDAVGKTKKSVRILLSDDENFDNLIFDSKESSEIDGIAYAVPIKTKPRTRYYYKVLVKSNEGKSAEKSSWFETGKMNEKWNAKWISAPFSQTPYVSNGVKSHFRPRFTFFGFRYVKVIGDITSEDLKTFKAYALYSQMDKTGYIKTGNDKVNKLISNILWGQKGNFLDIPTDCPQRDERLGWTGDTQIFSGTALFNYDCTAFYCKYMKDLLLEQELLEGGVPFVIPLIKAEVENFILKKHSSCAWGDVATILPWNLYKYSGDKTLLEKHYPAMVKWVKYIKDEDDKNGGKRLWLTGFHFADWLALDNFRNKDKPMGGTNEYYIASIFYYYSTFLTAKAAKELKKNEEAIYFFDLASQIKKAIKNEYFTPAGRCAIDTQTARVLALNMNIVEGKEKERVAKDLVEMLVSNHMKMETGFCGTPYLCKVLSENGYIEEAYTIFLREELPGWLYEVNMGATTVWERWNSVMPDGTMNSQGMNSLNHYAYGAVKEWLYSYVCGIKLNDENCGCKIINIEPKPDIRLKKAHCKFNSAAGEYKSAWEYIGNTIKYDIEVPFDAKAYVKLGNEEVNCLTSGKYCFIVEI